MEIDTDKIDETVLALLWLTLHDGRRAWKGFDWDALGRLHDKGLIADPVNKAKSVVLTEEGLQRAEKLFGRYLRGRGLERVTGVPVPGQQLVEPKLWRIGNDGQDVGEPGVHVGAVVLRHLCRRPNYVERQ